MKRIFTALFLIAGFSFGQILNDLVISEYVEGSSYNKYLEIANYTGADISLSDYDLVQYNNGSSTVTYTLSVGASTLTNGSVFVIANSNATVWSGTPNISTSASLMTFNGNDVIALRKNLINIDVIGTIGNSTNFAIDITLQRKAGVNPTTTYNQNNFNQFPQNYVDGLGILAPVPVELTTFTASVLENKVKLEWETATEVNNYGFEIERRTNLQEGYKTVAFVHGNGNSNSPKFYSYEDNTVSNSGKYLYRLKQIDIDGTYEFSDEVEVILGAPNKIELAQNYPNPFNPVTSIQFTLPTDSQVKLSVFNILGEEIAVLLNEKVNAGYHSVNFNGSELNSGIYFYQIQTDNFTQIRKMMLVK